MEFMTVYQFNSELNAFRAKVNSLKRELMIGTIGGQKELDTFKLDNFRVELKDLLHRIKVYGDDIARKIKATTLPDELEVQTVPYDLIKEFIFLKPDYRSISGFTSGLIEGTSDDGILKSAGDINDFFTHTAEMAFKMNVESTGELLEKCQFVRDSVEQIMPIDRKMFNSLGGYPDMFMVTDVGDIFTSVSRSLRELSSWLVSQGDGSNSQRLIAVAALNSYCEYINFTVTVYFGRAFMIGYYLAPIWYKLDDKSDVADGSFSEAVNPDELDGDCQFQPLRELEQGTILNPKSVITFLNTYRQLVKFISRGTPKGIPTGDTEWAWDGRDAKAAFQRVVIDSGMSDNILLAKVILSEGYFYSSEQRDEIPVNITEMYHNLKSSLGNSKQSLQLKASAKDDLIRVISSANGVKNMADLRKLAKDSLILSGGVLTNIRHRLMMMQGTITDGQYESTIGNQKLVSECHLMLLELYRDLASASYDKAILIDKLYRRLIKRANDDIKTSIELDLTALINSDQVQAPATMRVSEDMLPKYQQPILEYLELKDEFLRSLPEFENDLYLSEAGGSSLSNAISSLIESLIASVAAFFKNFKSAANWVKSREKDLRAVTFGDGDKLSGVRQYKVGKYDELIKGLSLANVKANVGKPSDQFAASLYPSQEIFNWFKSDKKSAAIKYSNSYLFGKATTDEIPTVTLSGKDLTAAMREWIDDILSSEAAMAKLNATNAELKELVKYLREEAVKVKPAPAAAKPTDTAAAPEVPEQDKKNDAGDKLSTTTVQSKPETDKSEADAAGANERLVRVQNAIVNLWKPVSDGLVKTFRDEYGYLKQAYAITQNKSSEAEGGKPTSQNSDKDKSGI